MTSVLVSPTQSGKTGYIQNLAHESLKNGNSVFIVLRNITADLLQFCKRWSFDSPLNPYDSITESPSVYICLSNVHQLSKMYCTIDRLNHPFIIILDEADLIYLDKKESKQTTMLYDEMYKNKYLKHKYYITATPFSLFKYIPDIKCENIKTLDINEKYVGFQDIKKWHVLGTCIKRTTKPDNYSKYAEKYLELLQYIIRRKSHQIVLFNCTSLIAIQEKLGKDFFLKLPVNVIVDHGEHTIVYSKNIINSFSDGVSMQPGFRYIFKKVHIKEILKSLKNDSTQEKIVIVSGIKAGRGQSYKTEDSGEWHLTDIVYLPPVYQTCETLIQACGRITGVYDKTPELHIWTSRKAQNSILEYIDYQKNVLNCCKNSKDKIVNVISEFEYTGSFKII